MTQPFDSRDWDLRQIAEKDAEIERLKDERDEWKTAYSERFENWKALLTRAANALECHNLDHLQDDLIAELRKTAQ